MEVCCECGNEPSGCIKCGKLTASEEGLCSMELAYGKLLLARAGSCPLRTRGLASGYFLSLSGVTVPSGSGPPH